MSRAVIFVVCVLLFAATALTGVDGGSAYDEVERIVRSDEYHKFEAPGEATNETTTVELGIYIEGLIINERAMTAEVAMYFRQRWTDRRLRFRSTSGSKMIRNFDPDAVWLPDSFFRFAMWWEQPAATELHRLRIADDGQIFYVQRKMVKFVLHRITQREDGDGSANADYLISIDIESNGYTGDTMIFSTLQDPLTISPTLPGVNVTSTQYRDCSQLYSVGMFPCMDFMVFLKRSYRGK